MHSSDSENIPRKITHLKLFADEEIKCTFTNKSTTFLMTNTTVIPRIKNTNMVYFSCIRRRHPPVLLRIKRLS